MIIHVIDRYTVRHVLMWADNWLSGREAHRKIALLEDKKESPSIKQSVQEEAWVAEIPSMSGLIQGYWIDAAIFQTLSLATDYCYSPTEWHNKMCINLFLWLQLKF